MISQYLDISSVDTGELGPPLGVTQVDAGARSHPELLVHTHMAMGRIWFLAVVELRPSVPGGCPRSLPRHPLWKQLTWLPVHGRDSGTFAVACGLEADLGSNCLQGVSRIVSSEGPRGKGLSQACIFSQYLHTFCPLYMSVSRFSLLIRVPLMLD